MKLAQPILLSLEKEKDNIDPVHLFGWDLDKENAVIRIAANKGCNITAWPTTTDYKTVMLDIIAGEPFQIGKLFIDTEHPEFIEQGIIEVLTKTGSGNTVSSKMLLCDFMSLHQYQLNVVEINRQFWINPTVEVIVNNLHDKAVMRLYPVIRQNMEERERDFAFAPDDEKKSLAEHDVKKGCGAWIMLKNKTDQLQKAKMILVRKESVDTIESGSSEEIASNLLQTNLSIDNENVEVGMAMPGFSKKSDREFTLYSDRLILHKLYSSSPMQVIQPINIGDKRIKDEITVALSPYQVNPNLVKIDYDLTPVIENTMLGDNLAEFTVLPNATLVLFFSEKD